MSAIRVLVLAEIERLRRESEALKQQSKHLAQRADTLEQELEAMPDQSSSLVSADQFPSRTPERGGRADAVVALLDTNTERNFNVELMQKELGVRIDPSLLSRLKREGKIAKARIGGYCSIKSSSLMREDDADSLAIQEELVS